MSDAPWASDLAAAFPDPAVAAQVDEFLRGNIQPYVTTLEEKAALSGEVNEFWNQWQENPGDTWFEMTKELVGEEKAQAILDAVNSGEITEAEATEIIAQESGDPAPSALSDEDRAILDEIKADRQRKAYDDAVNGFIEANPEIGIQRNLFDPFVAAAQGDLQAAAEGYKTWAEQAKISLDPEAAAAANAAASQAETQQEAPPVIAGSDSGVTTPPVQTEYHGNIDKAVDDFFDEQRASAPPVVGAGS